MVILLTKQVELSLMMILPEDIIHNICYYLTIKDITNLYLTFEVSLNKCFWIQYFKLNDLKIISDQNNVFDWINEYKVCSILDKFNKPVQCRYKTKNGKNKGSRCIAKAIKGCIYCVAHDSYDEPNILTIHILCNNFTVDYIKKTKFGFGSIANYVDYDLPEIKLTDNSLLVYIDIRIFHMKFYNNIMPHDFLFQLFKDNLVKEIR